MVRMRRQGALWEDIAAKIGVEERTLRRWRERHPELRKACEEADAECPEYIAELCAHAVVLHLRRWRRGEEPLKPPLVLRGLDMGARFAPKVAAAGGGGDKEVVDALREALGVGEQAQ